MTLNILGTKYTVSYKSPVEDTFLENCAGYCDKTSHAIVVSTKNINLDDFPAYQKTVLRHEIIHAFLFESGLSDSLEHKPQGHEETVIDWIAIQFPKILEVFEKAGAL